MFDKLAESFSSLFSRLTGQSRLSENNIEQAYVSIGDALLDADVPYEVVQSFLKSVRDEVVGQKITASLRPGEQFAKIVHDRLVAFLGGNNDIAFSFKIPSVTLVIGLQGSGKTTCVAKLARYAIEQARKRGKERRVLLASVDVYRPAAIDQLELLAGRVGASFYRSTSNEAVPAARDIVNFYKKNQFELLILDTAGRLHVDEELMKELREIAHIASPAATFLVVDAMIGQESLEVAQSFQKNIGFDYAILSKMDSDTRGGAAFAFRYSLKKPIPFIGTGEKLDELESFIPARVAKRLIGMGDLHGLIERAEEKIRSEDKIALERSFKRNGMTLEDFAQQMDFVNKMGSLESLARHMPLLGGKIVSTQEIEQGKQEMKKFRAIISSMTHKERIYPAILDQSRKKRIAAGAGATIADIKVLLDRFEKSQQFVKLFKKLGRIPGF